MADTEKKSGEIVRAEPLPTEIIKGLILTVRGKQVLLDSDVAMLYGYETKYINRAAARNKERFPPEFRFQLTKAEADVAMRTRSNAGFDAEGDVESPEFQSDVLNEGTGMRFQNGTASKRNERFQPYVYTQQGIGMLSGMLKNDTAVQVSIGIMNAFVEMQRFIYANRNVFARIVNIDNQLAEHGDKLADHDRKFDEVFKQLQSPETIKQSVFFKGEFYEAFKLIIEIIGKAKNSVTVIDNYVDATVLDMLTKKKDGVAVTIVTSKPSRLAAQHLEKFQQQYGKVAVIESKDFHDRFIILDNTEVYALGASLKDAGNKCFGVWKMEDTASQLINHVCNITTPQSIA